MDIVIFGSGNVATVLGRKFLDAGHHILQVVSRNEAAASLLAKEWNSENISFSGEINSEADLYLIAVTDDAINGVKEKINLSGKVVAHTAASVSKEVLKSVSEHYGVFYPLQSLRKEMTDLSVIPILYDGSDEITRSALESLAISISAGFVSLASDEIRSKYHLAAVFVNNFTNHLYALAAEYSEKEGIFFNKLLPLIEETANRIKSISPGNAQTGPAIRKDEETIRKHQKMLATEPELLKIYESMTESIRNFRRG